jgi:hypothetical protein
MAGLDLSTQLDWNNRMNVADQLYKSALLYKDNIAARCDDETMTYAQLDEQSNRLANALLANGLHQGDRVFSKTGHACAGDRQLICIFFSNNFKLRAKLGGETGGMSTIHAMKRTPNRWYSLVSQTALKHLTVHCHTFPDSFFFQLLFLSR